VFLNSALNQIFFIPPALSNLFSFPSNFSLDFNDIVAHTLKTGGKHAISGKWELPEVSVSGDLKNVLINQLNLADDIVRIPENNKSSNPLTVEALKTVNSATPFMLRTCGSVARLTR